MDNSRHFPRRVLTMLMPALLLALWSGGCSRDESPAEPPPAEPSEQTEEAPTAAEEQAPPNAQAIADFNAMLESVIDAEEALARRPEGPAAAAPETATAAAPPKADEAPAPVATSTDRSYKEKIVGTWTISRGGRDASIEFKSDGTASMSTAGQTMEATYTWDSADAFTMSMSVPGPNGATISMDMTVTVRSLDDNEMTLVFSQGGHEREETLTRAD